MGKINAVGDVLNVAEKKKLPEHWAHVVRIVLGWMQDIDKRVDSVSWGATTQHRTFIEFIENVSEDTTFEEYKRQVELLMQMHAMARNDLYDGDTWKVQYDDDGRHCEEWRTVTRQEKDVIAFCNIWWKHQ